MYHEQAEGEKEYAVTRKVNQIGKIVGDTIREHNHNQTKEFCPCGEDINMQHLREQVPDILTSLITSMFSPSRSDNAKLKKGLLQTSTCHVLMQAASK